LTFEFNYRAVGMHANMLSW